MEGGGGGKGKRDGEEGREFAEGKHNTPPEKVHTSAPLPSRLGGLVVKTSASRAAVLWFESRLRRWAFFLVESDQFFFRVRYDGCVD